MNMMYDLIVIGSGPAGLSAAVYGKRAGLDLLVLEKNPMSGGQVLNTYEVDNYLGMPGMDGFDMGTRFREHADKLGVEFMEATALSLEDRGGHKLIRTDQGELEAKTVILATGAVHAMLGAPGEERLGGRGVSYCATCDGAFFRGRTVAVVGGGDVALEDAIYLARTSEKVYLIHRRDELRGAMVLQQELKGLPNVEILYSHVVEEILGEDTVEAVTLKDCRTEETFRLPVDGVFVAVGIRPQTELVRGLAACDEGGYVLAGEDCATDVPGLFVAGDVRRKPLRQIVTAVADGANAAVSAGSCCRES
ncbi:FAD-dependent oxidoreductase [uncultured Acetatifactor sp.]|jgi:thioredoxin reductase (NADPH)|uniref:NAD(P)/FAD-dependent oxidoreductase n=1 Tax=uncultured Acetatifactor sp. TaxID=1671927 RepID=UPI00263914DC|nr:FAD-dependent oxidoreductase [uncultured Acetatifactor sp.]